MFVLNASRIMNSAEHRDRVARRDPHQEDDVEQRPEDDVRLPPAPLRDRVVADVADGRLDDDPDDRRADADDEHRRAHLVLGHEAVELEAVGDEQADRGVDRRQAQPVERDPEQVRQRQERGRCARPLRVGSSAPSIAVPGDAARSMCASLPHRAGQACGPGLPSGSSVTVVLRRTSRRSVAPGAANRNSDRSSE